MQFSGQDKVPILGMTIASSPTSWAIALYLERTFPDGRSLFGGPTGENLTQFFNLWADRELIPALVPYLMRDVLDCVDAADAAHLRRKIERDIQEVARGTSSRAREGAWSGFRRKLPPVRKTLERKKFFGGGGPTYADYILFGVLQWVAGRVARRPCSSPTMPWQPGSSALLDLYGGVGAAERVARERNDEGGSGMKIVDCRRRAGRPLFRAADEEAISRTTTSPSTSATAPTIRSASASCFPTRRSTT